MVSDVKTVLVTGATGFVGHYVVDQLLTLDGVRVITTARTKPATPRLKTQFIPFDLRTDASDVDLFTYFNKPDLVIHLAWQGLPDYKSLAHINTYWLQHYRFLTNLLRNGLTNLTVTGTCLEYGLQSGCLSEALPTQPTTAYGLAKDTLRKALDLFLTGQNVSFRWLRLFYMHGKGQNPRSLLAQVEAAAQRNEMVFNMSKGEQLRDYLPIDTVANYIVQAALQTTVTGVINCCSGRPIAVRTLVEQFMEEHQYRLTLNLGYYPYPDYEPLAFWGNSQKLETILTA
ncbi:NAD-dependent epimerase/dehydratase family protein [Spirosoma agri]|uniref:NAD-dependent epimerase/dehydratase family protein n=1 Tax=Spirosoma agri TaxID=1987381 RepID=A0A6M0IBK4_9BACT|nr:NAD-dependent epimerase/dehydratase family protein [Spirosoma agri]NEU65596.1 NAD-dependent epimerase/dehydratase family protein [Spirosoma agri]